MSLSSLWDSLTSYYDAHTDKIVAKPNSLAYYHEERHRWQNERKYLDAVNWAYYVLMPWAILTWNILPAAAHYGMIVGLELDAWWYSFERRRAVKRSV